MEEKIIYQNILSKMVNSVVPKLNKSISDIDNVLDYMGEAISVNGNSLKRSELREIKEKLVDKRNYINNILIPYIRRKVAEAVE